MIKNLFVSKLVCKNNGNVFFLIVEKSAKTSLKNPKKRVPVLLYRDMIKEIRSFSEYAFSRRFLFNITPPVTTI
jgi:hypothetical protein